MWSHRPVRLATAVAALCLFAACSSDSTGPGEVDTFEWTGAVEAGDVVEIKGVSGSIVATPSPDDEVRLFATKRGDDDDPDSVIIDVVEHDGGVTICAVYPDVSGQPANECLPGQGGFLSNGDNDVVVTFEVEVPDLAGFVGVTVAGSITATGLAGDVQAITVAGNVELQTDGQAQAVTVDGHVDADIGRSMWNRDLGFITVNGDVTVRIPSDTDAVVTGATVNGSVSSDFALTISGDGRLMQGTLGEGGRLLTLTTVNGNVALRER